MTTFEWAMVSIAAGGFLVTIGSVLGGCIWAVARIQRGMDTKIATESTARAAAITAAMTRFEDAQTVQDHNFGEVGLSLRRFIEEVEKEMHRIEIWGRDNFALKHDVADLRTDIKDMRKDIKDDFTALNSKIDGKGSGK